MKIAKIAVAAFGILVGIIMVFCGVVLASEASSLYYGESVNVPHYSHYDFDGNLEEYFTDNLEALKDINENINNVGSVMSANRSAIKNGFSMVMAFGGLITVCAFSMKLLSSFCIDDSEKRKTAKKVINKEHFDY